MLARGKAHRILSIKSKFVLHLKCQNAPTYPSVNIRNPFRNSPKLMSAVGTFSFIFY